MLHDWAVMKNIFAQSGISMARLHSLQAVVRAGGISRVAKRDSNVQTKLSRQISELENALGLKLLDRTRKPHAATEVARRLADVYGAFVREVEEILTAAGGSQFPISVGAGEVVIREFLIPAIGKMKKGVEQPRWVFRNLKRGKIQEGLASEWLDLGIASGLVEDSGSNVKVVELESYGFKLLLFGENKPDERGWKRLKNLPVAMLDGDTGFRNFVLECCRGAGVKLLVGAECTSFPQAVDMAKDAGWAVFVPDYWWKREDTWRARTQKLPELDEFRRTFQLGWNEKVANRRPEVENLLRALRGMKSQRS